MTHENPATTLYRAWDGIFKVTAPSHLHNYLAEQVMKVDPAQPHWLDTIPATNRTYYGCEQLVDLRTSVFPTAITPDGQYVYGLAWERTGHGRELLFQLTPTGEFRLGSSAFGCYVTRGVFDRVEKHTFLGWNRLYRRVGRERAFYFAGLGARIWLDPRDWREHRYYWREGMISKDAWLRLRPMGATWQVEVAPGFENSDFQQRRLVSEYEDAEAYYAKWRRKHFRDHNIPDPERRLDASDIETVDYLTQHLRVYDPPKARMPA